MSFRPQHSSMLSIPSILVRGESKGKFSIGRVFSDNRLSGMDDMEDVGGTTSVVTERGASDKGH